MSLPSSVDAERAHTTIDYLLKHGIRLLAEAGIETARQETIWLLESVVELSPLQLHLQSDRILTPFERERFADLVARRAAREPLQYLLGTQEFFGRNFHVTPAVLIPRPETELLVQEVIRSVPADRACVMVDMGTGSGCLAVTLALQFHCAQVVAVDRSPAALAVAVQNAERHGVTDRIQWLEGDLCGPLEDLGLQGRVSVVVANPPYIPDGELDRLQPEVGRYEPRQALAGGPDGMAVHRRLIREVLEYMETGGLVALEVGIGQSPSVASAFAATGGYGPAIVRNDGAGIGRVVSAIRQR